MILLLLRRMVIAAGVILAALLLAILGLMGLRALRIFLFQRRLKRARAGECYVDFRHAFDHEAVSEPIARTVYEILSCEIPMVHALPVRASDSLQEIYGIDGFSGMERIELVELIAARCDLDLDSIDQVDTITTVADLVLWFEGSDCVHKSPVYTVAPASRPKEGIVTLRQAQFPLKPL